MTDKEAAAMVAKMARDARRDTLADIAEMEKIVIKKRERKHGNDNDRS